MSRAPHDTNKYNTNANALPYLEQRTAFLSRWCVFGANLVLYRPNDGTTELKKAQLAGATHAGHKEGWCHTNGMKFQNQCADPERNKEMNAAAAR